MCVLFFVSDLRSSIVSSDVFPCSRNNFVGFTSAAKTIRHLLCGSGQVWAFCLAAFGALMWASEKKLYIWERWGVTQKWGNARARNESNAFSNSVLSRIVVIHFVLFFWRYMAFNFCWVVSVPTHIGDLFFHYGMPASLWVSDALTQAIAAWRAKKKKKPTLYTKYTKPKRFRGFKRFKQPAAARQSGSNSAMSRLFGGFNSTAFLGLSQFSVGHQPEQKTQILWL